jgi:7-cyano-7-deazaguanine synthase in queuosine biosynthesis
MQNKNFKILLLSGGADSMLLNQRYVFDKKIFFDYGQKHKENEFEKCKEIIDEIITLPKFFKKDKEVNCRNFTFVSNIVSIYGDRNIEIYFGTNKEDRYNDNNRNFYNDLEDFINKISINQVCIKTPLIEMTKNEILKELKSEFYTD